MPNTRPQNASNHGGPVSFAQPRDGQAPAAGEGGRDGGAVPQRSGIFAPFASRDYRSFSLVMLVTQTGLSVTGLGRAWLVQSTTHSPFLVSAMAALTGLPMMVFGVVGGVVADRFSRKYVAMVMDAVTAASSVTLAVIYVAGGAQTWHVLLLASIQGVAQGVSSPAKQTLLTDLVPDRQQRGAIGLAMVVGNIGGIIGPLIAAVAFGAGDVGLALTIGAAIQVATLPLYLLIATDRPAFKTDAMYSFFSSLKEGIRHAANDRNTAWLMVAAAILLTTLSTRGVIYPTLIQDVYKRGPGSLGVLELAGGLGAVMGPFVASFLSGKLGDIRLEVWSAVVFAASVALMAFTGDFWMFVGLSWFTSCAGQVVFATNWYAIQLSAPHELRGRVVSLRFAVSGVQHIGMLGLGAMAVILGPRAALIWFVAAGLGLFAFATLLMRPRTPTGRPLAQPG